VSGFETWTEAYVDGLPHPTVGVRRPDGGVAPPTFLYRVMSRAEFDAARASGAFAPRPGERIHAASRPHIRYADPGDVVVVRFRWDDGDGWRAKWGDELYAVTDRAIPFGRADGVAFGAKAGLDPDAGFGPTDDDGAAAPGVPGFR
jgi:hypothetical protein